MASVTPETSFVNNSLWRTSRATQSAPLLRFKSLGVKHTTGFQHGFEVGPSS